MTHVGTTLKHPASGTHRPCAAQLPPGQTYLAGPRPSRKWGGANKASEPGERKWLLGGLKGALNSLRPGSSPFTAGVGLRVTDGCGREVASEAL